MSLARLRFTDFICVVPMWSSVGDLEEIEQRLARIKADLMCELVAVSLLFASPPVSI